MTDKLPDQIYYDGCSISNNKGSGELAFDDEHMYVRKAFYDYEIHKMKEENKRLREALEDIKKNWGGNMTVKGEQALKEQ